ncbi:MAG: NADH-quinone oxidoreductase subunit NuoE [Rhodobacteraceae bacterium]|nr:NADH-quinone oxidoreductase subunit NuoE [Paracoccaceae bacterium]
MTLPEDLKQQILHAVAEDGGAKAAMLEALRLVQQAEGWVSDARLAQVADLLGVSTAELDSIATFYSLIFRKPVGQTVILLCDGASCWMNGGDALRQALMDRLGIGFGQTTADGRYSLINSACVGGCDRAPALLIGPDRRLVGPLSPEGVAQLLEGEL